MLMTSLQVWPKEEAMGLTSAGGLEGVVVAQTRLSDVDGEKGRLIIAGQDVEHLAHRASFEELCTLLWGGESTAAPREALARARMAAFERVAGLRADVLRME